MKKQNLRKNKSKITLNKFKKQVKGITLIALVVTIIVLLILAAVAINLTIGNNGIFTRAQDATKKWEEASKNEDEWMQSVTNQMDDIIGNLPQDEGNLKGDGTKESPYLVNYIEDLITISVNISKGEIYKDKYIKLSRDLDFEDDNSYKKSNSKVYGDLNGDGKVEEIKTELTTGNGFLPIGIAADNEDKVFSGFFDGSNYKIKNLKNIHTIEKYDIPVGLFLANNGEISNLIIENITLEYCGEYTSGICYYNLGKIKNCKTTGTINLTNVQEFGGIVGNNNGIIYKCANEAEIVNNGNYEGQMFISGICTNNYGNVILSANNGTITAINQLTKEGNKTRARPVYTTYISGIAYTNYGEINGCYNSGDLYGKGIEGFNVSGIAYDNYDAKIFNCYNKGMIKGEDSDSGNNYKAFYAISKGGIIKNCYNVGAFETEGNNFGDVEIEIELDPESVSNYYYKNDILDEQHKNPIIIEKTEEEMKSEDFITLLNVDTDSTLNGKIIFSKDDGSNNGYPIITENNLEI